MKVKAVAGWQRSSSPVVYDVMYNDKCPTQQKKSHRAPWLCLGKLARGKGFMRNLGSKSKQGSVARRILRYTKEVCVSATKANSKT